MHYKLIAILILVGLVVLFIVQNVAVVEMQFLFWSIQMPRCPDAQMPRSLMIFLVLGTGMIIGWFLSSFLGKRAAVKKAN